MIERRMGTTDHRQFFIRPLSLLLSDQIGFVLTGLAKIATGNLSCIEATEDSESQ